MSSQYIRNFFKLEYAGGILLFAGAVFALIFANSALAPLYQAVFTTPLEIQLGSYQLGQPLLFWINEGLMSLFFLVVGLELKREFVEGELAHAAKVFLPAVAALGGMLVPALLFVLVNWHHPLTLKGWPIPVATDIAFALGVLALFGKRVPVGLKLFLMSLAIFDDLGAIIIIALFHSADLSIISLVLASLALLILYSLNRLNVRSLIPYLIVGFILWLCVLGSGIHATLAGVMLALFIPTQSGHHLERALQPWVAFFILPFFAFGNAGVVLSGMRFSILVDYVTLGTIVGLVIGKQLGVISFAFMAIRLGWSALPRATSWRQFYGVAWLCGIGFTMSLFLGTLAFEHDSPLYLSEVRVGVLVGSTLSGLIGVMILHYAFRKKVT